MADYFPGEIYIGGDVPLELIPELLQIAAADGACLDYGEQAIDAEITAEELLAYIDGDGALKFCAYEARYGEFQELESWLQSHGIPYDRHSDSRYEFTAEWRRWRPGMELPLVTVSNNDGGDFCEVAPVAAAREALLATNTGLAMRWLDRALEFKDVPELPPFRITTPAGPLLPKPQALPDLTGVQSFPSSPG